MFFVLAGTALVSAISQDIEGVLLVQFIPPDAATFGNELMAKLARNPDPATKGLAIYEGGPGYALPGPPADAEDEGPD